MSIQILSITGMVLMVQIVQIMGHGRLLNPPARSSAWREDPSRFQAYYDDNQMFCGGFGVQWNQNGGQCGICGENARAPKLLEKGGSLYRGYIVRSYTQGQRIQAVVELTANHLGYYEFRLCNVDGQNGDATQSCLDRTLLTDTRGNTKMPISKSDIGKKIYTLVLPSGFSCNHCVFQWKYNSGNSWGSSGLGSDAQEQFYGCADIRIVGGKKREWDVVPDKVEKTREMSEPETREVDEMTQVSSNLLKRLFTELKRLKTLEMEQNEKRAVVAEDELSFNRKLNAAHNLLQLNGRRELENEQHKKELEEDLQLRGEDPEPYQTFESLRNLELAQK